MASPRALTSSARRKLSGSRHRDRACDTVRVSERPLRLATIDGYAVEGGFDHGDAPATCYSAAIQLGQIEGPKSGENLFAQLGEVISLVPELGLDGIALSLEWARLEPRVDQINEAAYETYAEALRHARALGLFCSVVLVDSAWPAWLGPEAWLLPWTTERLTTHARRVRERLGDLVDNVVPFAHAEDLVRGGFDDGTRPPWRRRATADSAAARDRLQRLIRRCSDDDVLGPLAQRRIRELPIAGPASALATTLASVRGVDDIHVRSLVRGSGPTASAAGMVAWRDSRWQVVLADDVREALA